jgi:hypothetical protein
MFGNQMAERTQAAEEQVLVLFADKPVGLGV